MEARGRVGRSGVSRLYPRKQIILARGDLLDVNELLDEFFERLVVELVLPFQHTQRDAAVLFEVATHLADDIQEIRRHDRSSCASRSTCAVAPIST